MVAAIEWTPTWKALWPSYKEQYEFEIGPGKKYVVDCPSMAPFQIYTVVQGVAIGRKLRLAQKPPKKVHSNLQKDKSSSNDSTPSTSPQDENR